MVGGGGLEGMRYFVVAEGLVGDSERERTEYVLSSTLTFNIGELPGTDLDGTLLHTRFEAPHISRMIIFLVLPFKPNEQTSRSRVTEDGK
jgi:hypothetical protein